MAELKLDYCKCAQNEFSFTSDRVVTPKADSCSYCQQRQKTFPTLKVSKTSSLLPSNDPSSPYNLGIKRAKLGHHKKIKLAHNREQTAERKRRSKLKNEDICFPQPSSRDFDRYRLFGKLPQTESSYSDIDYDLFSPYFDILSTLFSEENWTSKSVNLLLKVDLLIESRKKSIYAIEQTILRLLREFRALIFSSFSNISVKNFCNALQEIILYDWENVKICVTSFTSLLVSIVTSNSSVSVLEAVSLLLRKYLDNDLINRISPILFTFARLSGDNPFNKTSIPPVTESLLHDLADSVEDIGCTDFVKSCTTFLGAVLAFQVLPKDVEEWLTTNFPIVPTFIKIYAVRELTVSTARILAFLEDVARGRMTVHELICGSPELFTLLEQLEFLLKKKDKLYTGAPTPGWMDATEFCSRAELLIERSTTFLNRVRKGSRKRAELIKLKDELEDAYHTARTSLFAQTRQAPFFIYLYGPPGVGKSVMLYSFLQTYCRVAGKQFKPSMVYPRGAGQDYWEGYQPFSKWFIHLTEVASAKENILKTQGDSRIDEITSLVDSNPYHVNMAFEGKGKVYAIPKGVIADSNVADMGVFHHRACPSAYLRRPLFIEQYVHPDFCQDGSVQLDPQKVNMDTFDTRPYRFNIYRYTTADHSGNTKRTAIGLDWTHDQVDKYLTTYFEGFINHQSTIQKNFNDFIDERNEGLESIDSPLTESDSKVSSLLFSVVSVIFTILAYLVDKLEAFAFLMIVIVAVVRYELMGYFFSRELIRKYQRFRDACCLKLTIIGDRTRSFFSGVGFWLPVKVVEDNPFVSVSCLAFFSALALYLYNTRRKRAVAEGASEEIDSLHKEIGSSEGYPRVKGPEHMAWNVFQNDFTPSHKGDFLRGHLDLRSGVRKITVFVGGDKVQRSGTTMGFGVTKDMILFNKHILGDDFTKATINIHTSNVQDSSTLVIHMDEAMFFDMGNDLILLRHPQLRFKDRLKHFVSSSALVHDNCQLLIDSNATRMLSKEDNFAIADPYLAKPVILSSAYTYNWIAHERGKCGTPLVAQIGNGQCIIGIHSAGFVGNSVSVARAINREELESAIEIMNSKFKIQNVLSESHYFDTNLIECNSKSAWRFEDLKNFHYIGTIPGFVMANNVSKLCDTAFTKHLPYIFKKFFRMPDERFGKPLMKSKVDRDGNWISPVNNWYRKACTGQYSQSYKTCMTVNSLLTKRFKEGLSHLEGKLSPLTIECAINGVENDAFIKRMNVRTSAGYGWKGKKEQYLPVDEEVTDSLSRVPTEELTDRIFAILEQWKTGESANIVYCGKFKDEPRPLSKCKAGKTRIFFVSPIEMVVIGRMLLAPFYTLMVEHGDLFCTAVGINAHTQWDRMVRRYKSFSPYIMEGDISGFDVSQVTMFKASLVTVICEILEFVGYNDEALIYVRAYLNENLHVFIEILNDVFIAPGKQPSGMYATAEDNSLLLLFMFVYYYVEVTGREDFFEKVLLTTYGDDSILSVKEEVSEQINNLTFQTFCRERYNIIFTSASKSEELTKFVKLEETSFLKRGIKYLEEYDFYVGPLSISSMYKSLEWLLPSSFVTREEQHVAMAQSFLWEAFFHLDADKHYELSDTLKDILLQAFPGCNVQVLPNYDVIRSRLNLNFATNIAATEAYYSDPDSSAGQRVRRELTLRKNPSRRRSSACGCAEDSILSPSNNNEEICGISKPTHYGDIKFSKILKNGSVHSGHRNPKIFAKYRAHMEKYKLSKYRPSLDTMSDYVTESDMSPTTVYSGDVEESKVDVVHTLTSVNGESSADTTAGRSRSRAAGQKELDSIDKYLERPIEVSTFTIPTAAPAHTSVKLDVWDIISLEPSIRAKLKNFAYLNCDLQITITISGTPFHFGKLLISYQPFPARNDVLKAWEQRMVVDAVNYRNGFLTYLSQAPGAIVMDVKDNQPLNIDIPYISYKPMHRLFNSATTALTDVTSYDDLAEAGSLYIYSLNLSGSVSSSPSDISVMVQGCMKNVNLGTLSATVTQITTEAKDEEWTSGPIERTSAAIASFLGKLSIIPEIAPLSVPGAMVFEGVSGIASYFGWSKPIEPAQVSLVKQVPYTNGAHVIGYDTNYRLTLDPKQALSVDTSFVGTTHDEMVLNNISSRESYLTSFTWAESNAPLDGAIWKCAVTPELYSYYNTLGRTWYSPTTTAFISKCFQYWRGTMHFRVEVVCSAYHRGKIAIVFEPNIDQHVLIDADVSLNKQYIKIIDIQETQSVDFCVGWAAPFPWLKLGPQDGNNLEYRNAYGTAPDLTKFAGHANGYIRVVPYTRLQSPDSSPVEVNVYCHSPDLRVQGPHSGHIPDDRTGFITEAYMTTHDVSCMELNPSTATSDYLDLDYFGEHIASFRSLLKRYTTHDTLFTGGTNGWKYLNISGSILPCSVVDWNTVGTPSRISLIDYIRYAYLGMRGSMRYRFTVAPGEGITIASLEQASISLATPGVVNNVLSSTLAPTYDGYARFSGTCKMAPAHSNGLEADFPYYSPNLFSFACAEDFIGTNPTGSMELEYYRDFKIQLPSAGLTSGTFVVAEIASGEDFTLMRFLGSVPFTLVQS